MPFYLDGVNDVVKRLKTIADRTQKETAKAIRYEVEKIGTAADRIVPVDLGALRASRTITGPTINGSEIECSIGYGGAAAAYAVAVHETPSEHDPPSWEGVTVNFKGQGQRKYLETPLRAAMPGMSERIAERIKPK